MTPPLFVHPQDRLIVALDVSDVTQARRLVATLDESVGYYKVGLELFMAAGPSIFDWLPASRVMLDLKLHDIPETVERAAKIAVQHQVALLTLHVQQAETLGRVAQVTQGTKTRALGVTVLTSMDAVDLKNLDIGQHDWTTPMVVVRRALFASKEGLSGFVCSPKEVRLLREALPPEAVLVVPGVRPEGAAKDDQKRTGTPYNAIMDGASAIVVGRPITKADDRLAAAKAIVDEIQRGLHYRGLASSFGAPGGDWAYADGGGFVKGA